MALAYVLDENLRGLLFQAIESHNSNGGDFIDIVRVGDPADLPLQSTDPVVLAWAERAGRGIVSNDRATMPGHFTAHLHAGRHLPGLFLLRPGAQLHDLVLALALIAHAGDPNHYADQVTFIP